MEVISKINVQSIINMHFSYESLVFIIPLGLPVNVISDALVYYVEKEVEQSKLSTIGAHIVSITIEMPNVKNEVVDVKENIVEVKSKIN